jgi:hypothetical protein
MTPARVPRREPEGRGPARRQLQAPGSREITLPISGGPGSRNFRSPRPVRDSIRHGPGHR